MEALTYRWKGHSKSDKNLYRTREEIAEWRDKDPIGRFETLVVDRGVLDAAAVEEVRTAATNDIRDAVAARERRSRRRLRPTCSTRCTRPHEDPDMTTDTTIDDTRQPGCEPARAPRDHVLRSDS